MKECSGTSSYQYGRNTCFFIKVTCTLKERRDWLFIPLNDLLHKGVPYHKISGRSIFIKKEKLAFCFHTFYDSGRLGSTSAGIQCGKTMGIFFIWKVIDEERNIDIFDKTAFLRTKLNSCVICDYIFASISWDMIIYAKFKRIQKSRFAMITTAYDQSDSLWNSHSCDCSLVWKLHGNTKTFRRIERDGILHRAGRNAAFSGKNSTISYKCAEISAGQFMTDEFLIFGKLHII